VLFRENILGILHIGNNQVDWIICKIEMQVSMAIGFLFLGGGMRTFATNKGAIAALLISLYPVFPTKPTDNNTHLQVKA
jgi:hypothetical protein